MWHSADWQQSREQKAEQQIQQGAHGMEQGAEQEISH